MKRPGPPLDPAKRAKILAELHRDVAQRQKGYREQALKILPHICARCARQFDDRRLSELTVHHKDHDYHNNPQDGSNWELLCIYCHDHEHEKQSMAGHYSSVSQHHTTSTFSPFEALDCLLKPKPAAETKPDAAPPAKPDDASVS